LTKNITSKSVILAPFNTSEEQLDLNESDVQIEKAKIKFLPNVREYDRQFERNNNGELDNGVYNKKETSISIESEDQLDDKIQKASNSKNDSLSHSLKKALNKQQYLSETAFIKIEENSKFIIGNNNKMKE